MKTRYTKIPLHAAAFPLRRCNYAGNKAGTKLSSELKQAPAVQNQVLRNYQRVILEEEIKRHEKGNEQTKLSKEVSQISSSDNGCPDPLATGSPRK